MIVSSVLHNINILVHVAAGTLALLTGLLALIAKKGRYLHKRSGQIFLVCLGVVILTGLVGVFIFKLNTFLLVITVLSGYLGYSGYRVLKNKTNKLLFTDVFMAFCALLSAAYFLYYFKTIGLMWSPVIIYSTVGYLLLIVSFDLGRYFLPTPIYAHLWMYEHILKMISAFSALLSAFTGTVLPQYHPYSQFLPSVFGSLLAIIFMRVYYLKNTRIRAKSFIQNN